MKLKPYLIVFVLIISINNVNAQCAGANNSVTICNKELDASLQNYSLFNQLSGNPEAGGTWRSNDPLNQNALDTSSGVLNLWQISKFGSHTFTYTNTTCNQSATVEILLGGYAGEDNTDGSANACNIDSNVDLFSFLNNNISGVNPDINGTWEQISNNGDNFLTGKFFDATQAAPGMYTFRYTVDSVGNCPFSSSTVVLEVHREPISGTPTNLKICSTEDLSNYTNINLFDLLEGEDTNGIWSEMNGTNQIANNTDSMVNMEEVFNNFGIGNYSFTYTVSPTHGVCNVSESTVTISISDVSGQFNVNNICNSAPVIININHTNSNNDSFSYDLEYEIRNSTTAEVVFTNQEIANITIDGSNNNATIELPANTINTAGNYTITARAITNFNGVICDSFQITEANFTVFGPRISTSQLCFNGSNADILIDNLVDDNGVLVNDTFSVNYTIEDRINNVTRNIQNQEITFTNGTATLPVDISSFPENAIDYNLKIQSNTNQNFACIDFNFSAGLIPENITLDFLEGGSCNAKTLEAVINAPPLSNGSYTINYTITNQETSEIVANNPITLISGITNYNIDITNLAANNYTIVLNSSQNDTNPCRTQFEFENSTNFTINPPIPLPVVDNNQSFCINSTTNIFEPKISDIVVTSGENLIWYESFNSETPIDENTVLVDGEDYYVTSSNPEENCVNSDRVPVFIQLISPSLLTTNDASPIFCTTDNPNLANLSINENSNNILWYDAPTGGNLLNINTPIVNQQSYYAVENINGCEFDTRLQFTPVTLGSMIPEYTGSNQLCFLDRLTLADLETNITTDAAFNLVWFDALEGGNIIDNTQLVEENVPYYVAGVNGSCESDRLLISVSLSNCDPNSFDFFIPDGFSPNNDGRNDTYHIPNIMFTFPDYELEIFNRYGQSIAKLNKDNPEWNGENSKTGKVTTSGVYFYILNYNSNNLEPKQGRIYLSK